MAYSMRVILAPHDTGKAPELIRRLSGMDPGWAERATRPHVPAEPRTRLARSNLCLEHDPSGQARGQAFPKTGTQPGSRPGQAFSGSCSRSCGHLAEP